MLKESFWNAFCPIPISANITTGKGTDQGPRIPSIMLLECMLLCSAIASILGNTCDLLVNERDECGWVGIGEKACADRGCCWQPSSRAPWCFQQRPRCQYDVVKRTNETLTISCASSVDDATSPLSVEVQCLQPGVLNLKVLSREQVKWTVPAKLIPKQIKRTKKGSNGLSIAFKESPIGFKVTRDDGSAIFDTADIPIVVQDYYVSFGTAIRNDSAIMGLGYRAGPLQLERGRTYALYSRDASTLPSNGNLYSAHPFYIEVLPDGQAHGLLFLNSHPMNCELSGDRLVFKSFGGIIDLYFFSGPTPTKVAEQLAKIIGRPPMYNPQFLGLQQSRYGYGGVDEMMRVRSEFKRAHLPLDVLWFDIEYSMTNHKM